MERKFKFTATRIAKLEHPGSATTLTFWDTEIGGSKFGIRVSASGVKTYFCQSRYPNGKPAKTTIGRADIWTPEDAREKAREYLKMYAAGIDPRRAAQEKPDLTLEKLFESFIALRRRGKGNGKRTAAMKASTETGYRQIFDRYMADWKDRAPETITKQEIIDRHERISRKHKSVTTNGRARTCGGPGVADGAMRVLNALFEYGCEVHEERIPRNPVKVLSKIGAYYSLPPRTRYVKPEDLPRTFDMIDSLRSQDGKDYIYTLMFTGARAEETACIRVRDIDATAGVATFRETKTGVPLTVPLPSFVAEIFRRRIRVLQLEPDDYLFPSDRSASGYYSCGKKALDRFQKLHGVKMSPHDFRRGYKTYCKNIGIDELTRKRLMNHALPSRFDMNEWYTQHELDELRKAVTRLERYILQQAGRWQGKVIQMRSAG